MVSQTADAARVQRYDRSTPSSRSARPGRPDHPLHLQGVPAERLLAKYGQAPVQCLDGVFRMQDARCGNHYGVQILCRQLAEAVEDRGSRSESLAGLQAGQVRIKDGRDLHQTAVGKGLETVSSNPSDADESQPHLSRRESGSLPCRLPWSSISHKIPSLSEILRRVLTCPSLPGELLKTVPVSRQFPRRRSACCKDKKL